MITIVCNGKERQVEKGVSVAEFIKGMGIVPDTVVVELNGEILSPDAYDEYRLSEAMVLELIRFVGGG